MFICVTQQKINWIDNYLKYICTHNRDIKKKSKNIRYDCNKRFIIITLLQSICNRLNLSSLIN